MAYPNYPYPGYPPYYPPPVPDQLAQLRQQQMQPPMMQTAPSQPQQTDPSGIIWVQGEAGAKAYLVAPGNTVQLWDSEDQVIYLKVRRYVRYALYAGAGLYRAQRSPGRCPTSATGPADRYEQCGHLGQAG